MRLTALPKSFSCIRGATSRRGKGGEKERKEKNREDGYDPLARRLRHQRSANLVFFLVSYEKLFFEQYCELKILHC